jgi:S-adenosylmethionine:tRNA-ribosyltransferase-isomerase (queuine synthetase)
MHKEPIISVSRARKKLGDEAAKYSDEQIRQIIADLDSLAEMALSAYIKHKSKALDTKHR